MLNTRTFLRRLSIGVALASAALALPATSLAATQVGIYNQAPKPIPFVKPSVVQLLQTTIVKIHWTHWTNKAAIGTGTIPYCASVTTTSCGPSKITVTFTTPRTQICGTKKVTVFSRAYTTGSPYPINDTVYKLSRSRYCTYGS